MKLPLALFALSGAATLATPALAKVDAEANVARSHGQWGGELGVGMPVIQDGGLSVTPLVGLFVYDRDHPNYYKNDGTCFARSDNDSVGDSHCDGTGTKIYAKVEAMYHLPASVGLGVGARWMGSHVRAYGTVSMPVLPRIEVKGNLGDHYLAAGVTAHF